MAVDIQEVESLFGKFHTRFGEVLEELRHARREARLAEIDRQGAEMDVPEGVPVDASEDHVISAHALLIQKVMGAAHRAWMSRIVEPDFDGDPPNGAKQIDEFIRGELGGGWSWEKEYVRNTQFAWCGMFAAHCYRSAGLKPAIARKVMPSCYRLYNSWRNTPRYVQLNEIETGDILVVGPVSPGAKKWGSHITIVESVDLALGVVNTIEGNAKGLGPDGQRYEGVIKQKRALHGSPTAAKLHAKKYRGLHVYRPLSGDFAA